MSVQAAHGKNKLPARRSNDEVPPSPFPNAHYLGEIGEACLLPFEVGREIVRKGDVPRRLVDSRPRTDGHQAKEYDRRERPAERAGSRHVPRVRAFLLEAPA